MTSLFELKTLARCSVCSAVLWLRFASSPALRAQTPWFISHLFKRREPFKALRKCEQGSSSGHKEPHPCWAEPWRGCPRTPLLESCRGWQRSPASHRCHGPAQTSTTSPSHSPCWGHPAPPRPADTQLCLPSAQGGAGWGCRNVPLGAQDPLWVLPARFFLFLGQGRQLRSPQLCPLGAEPQQLPRCSPQWAGLKNGDFHSVS